MHKHWRILSIIVVGVMVGGLARAQEPWRIEDFLSEVAVEADGGVIVKETIVVDFGNTRKHGIYRDLPLVYEGEGGDKTYTEILDIAVEQDGEGAEIDISRTAANMRIRIGDPNETVYGTHQYVVEYRVMGVLRAFEGEGFDELYWNVTGNEWEVPIERARARVVVPAAIVQAACYSGGRGSKQECDVLEQSREEVRAETTGLPLGEGLTVAVGYEPGVVPIVQVEAPVTAMDILADPVTGVVAVGVMVLGVGVVGRRWWKYGRDRYWQRAHLPGVDSKRGEEHMPEKILPLGRFKSVAVEYDPPDDLRPAEIGVLMDEKADTLDVSATIVDLAARGFLTIKEEAKKWLFGSMDYVFSRTDKTAGSLLPYEQTLLTSLFKDTNSVKLSELKNVFYKELAEVKNELYEEVARKKLFAKRPDTIRSASVGVAIVVLMVGIGLVVMGSKMLLAAVLGAGIGLIVVGVVALAWAPFMPRKTALGRELYERSQGYELFVSGTEKYRAKWMEKVGLFERVLPYAVMFGVTDRLAEALADLGIEPPRPDWYQGATAFDVAQFSRSISRFSRSLSTAMASSPANSGSGGGGSSGGGFGGGGGGSW